MTSKLGFIMAADGSAIGLGRFGSSRTLLEQRAAGLFSDLFNVYLPILLAEFVIGRDS